MNHKSSNMLINCCTIKNRFEKDFIHLMTLLFLLVILSPFLSAKQLFLKPSKDPETITMQIGEGRNFSYPEPQLISLQNIYSRQVVSLDKAGQTISRICTQTPPSVDFIPDSFYLLDLMRRHPEIPTEFNDLLYRRGVIDSILYQNQLYTLFENGSMLILQYSQNQKLVQKTVFRISDKVQDVQEGQILIVNQTILVIADGVGYRIDYTLIQQLNGDTLSLSFSYAVPLFKNYFAVAQLEEGVGIYSLTGNILSLVQTYGKQFFGSNQALYIVDLAYDNNNTLYVLDYNLGLMGMNISNLQTQLDKVQMLPSQRVVKTNCDNILYSSGQIIMVCQNIYKYSPNDDRSVKEFPKPMFKVKQMFASENIIVMTGDNLFNFYWFGRYLQLFQFSGANKIIVEGNRFIAIQDYAIHSGTYQIKGPVLYCQSDDLVAEQQDIKVLFETKATCNLEYMKQIGDTRVPEPNDTCIYAVTGILNFWRADKISIKPIIVGIIFVVAFVVMVLLWMTYIMIRQNKLTKLLKYYELSATRGEKGGYNVLAEEGGAHSNVANEMKYSFGGVMMSAGTVQSNFDQLDKDLDLPKEASHEIGE